MKRYFIITLIMLSISTIGCTSLNEAVIKGDAANVKKNIAKGEDVNLKDKNGDTPLITAVKNGNLEIIKMLIDAKADVNIKDPNGDTPLILAIKKGIPEIVKILIDAKADVNTGDIKGNTPLLIASGNGYADIVKMLIDAKADLDAMNEYDMDALLVSLSESNNREVNDLLDKYIKRPKADTLIIVWDNAHFVIGNYEAQMSLNIFGGGGASNLSYTPKGKQILYYFLSTDNELSKKVRHAGIKVKSGGVYLLKNGGSYSQLKYIRSFANEKCADTKMYPVLAAYFGVTPPNNGIFCDN